MVNFEPSIAPMTIKAWIILAVMLGLVAWGVWAEQRDQPMSVIAQRILPVRS